MSKFLLTFLCFLTSVPMAFAQEESRLKKVNDFMFIYETGYVYKKDCDDLGVKDEAEAHYMVGRELVYVELLNMHLKANPNVDKESVIVALENKRNEYTTEISERYKTEGCKSDLASKGKEVLKTFSSITPAQMKAYLDGLK